jgi:hypothetical protein
MPAKFKYALLQEEMLADYTYKETSIVNKYFDDLRLKCLICSVKANGRGRLQ